MTKTKNARRDNISFARAFLMERTKCTSPELYKYMLKINEPISQGAAVSALYHLTMRGEALKSRTMLGKREINLFTATEKIGLVPKLYSRASLADSVKPTPEGILMLQSIMRNFGDMTVHQGVRL